MSSDVSRRELFAAAAAIGIGSTTFHRAMATTAAAQPKVDTITPEMVEQAEWVAGITLTNDERKMVAARMTLVQMQLATLRKTAIGYDTSPAIHFIPNPGQAPHQGGRGTFALSKSNPDAKKPEADADLAFLPLHQLADLVRTKKVSSTELTKVYLARLKKYDPALYCAITITEELALKQAEEADKEIAAGKYRSPLHGVPWVAKDLIAYPGYPTTWGAGHFKEQKFDAPATVAKRLDTAGAVLVAKTTLGSLAWGDRWFGGLTRNPWSVKSGSSGSSAGTASAVAAGLAAYGLGSETLGSIVSPSHTCGVTGLRPTFGRVSRHGCMALCWSLDKVGPMARSAEDCALVLGAIHGADGKDATAQDRPFFWPSKKSIKEMRIGFEGKEEGNADLKVLKDLGATLVPIKLPHAAAQTIVTMILDVESATAFDDITREGVRAEIGMWPNTFRRARFIAAVDYLRAQRGRTLVMRDMAKAMENVDVDACPADNDLPLALTNLTGHPTVCLPNGFRKGSGTPTGLTFTGQLFGETELLAVAKAYQDATDHHTKRPPEETWVVEKKG